MRQVATLITPFLKLLVELVAVFVTIVNTTRSGISVTSAKRSSIWHRIAKLMMKTPAFVRNYEISS